MKKYDVIIIGTGGGSKIRPASNFGKRVAMIEKDNWGGTCLNRGCIPSKMLIHTAEVLDEVRGVGKYNIELGCEPKVNFEALIKRVNESTSKTSASIPAFYDTRENIDHYHGEARFVEDKVIEINGEQITADYIFIATGSRPRIPKIPGLEGTPYMTSTEAIRDIKHQPKKMIVIGGGYIATELGYFYSATGTEVDFVVRGSMITAEDYEIAEEFEKVFTRSHNVHLRHFTKSVKYEDGMFTVEIESADGVSKTLTADALFIAIGVQPNSDTLGLENTSIQTNEAGFIEVDDHLQTAVPGVYALGDVIGRYLFRHGVNFEAEYLLRTLFSHPADEPINYPPMPHAIFSMPQIAGIGTTEDELLKHGKERGKDYLVGINSYKDSAMGGDAWMMDHGLCKLIVDKESLKLIGAHIIGKDASNMIHMLIAFMSMDATIKDILRTIYIHPALPEIVRNAARKIGKELGLI